MVLLQFFFNYFFMAGVLVGRVFLLVFCGGGGEGGFTSVFFNGWGCVQEFIFTSFYGWGGG